MASTRKHLASGQVATGAAETTLYSPNSATTGTVASLTFYNAHASSTIIVTVYAPHAGAADSTDIVEKFSLDPGKSHYCRLYVNKTIEGATSQILSVLCDTSAALNYSVDGAEE